MSDLTTMLDSTHPLVLTALLDEWGKRQAKPSSPKWERDAERGLTDRDWHTCPTCQGAGTTTWKKRTVTCDRCQGAGGWKGDAYDGWHRAVHAEHAPELSVLDFARAAWELLPVDQGFSIWVLDEKVKQRANRRATSLDDALNEQARGQHPCFAHIDTAVIDMRGAFPYHSAIIVRIHILEDLPQRISDNDRELYEDALHLLGKMLPPEFFAPGWARIQTSPLVKDALWRGRNDWAKRKRHDREQLVRKWLNDGHTIAEVARRTGLTDRRIRQLRQQAA